MIAGEARTLFPGYNSGQPKKFPAVNSFEYVSMSVVTRRIETDRKSNGYNCTCDSDVRVKAPIVVFSGFRNCDEFVQYLDTHLSVAISREGNRETHTYFDERV